MDLVTCITPITESRRHYVDAVNKIITSQDYPNIEHLFVWGEGTIGAKRNKACELAKGNIIVHIDSDDWYAPDWVSKQVEYLKGHDICGLDRLYFFDEFHAKAWKYVWNRIDGPWVAGATMAYYRAYWEAGPFRDMQVGEDNYFVWKPGAKVAVSDYEDGFVARLHDNNTSPHNKTYRWKQCDREETIKVVNLIS